MKNKLFAIAKITRASGLDGEVGIRPLIRQFDEYVQKPLFIGFDVDLARDIKLEKISGANRKRRYQFKESKSREHAESMIGQLLFASIHHEDPINMISPDLLGATIITDSGNIIGELVDMMSFVNTSGKEKRGRTELLMHLLLRFFLWQLCYR